MSPAKQTDVLTLSRQRAAQRAVRFAQEPQGRNLGSPQSALENSGNGRDDRGVNGVGAVFNSSSNGANPNDPFKLFETSQHLPTSPNTRVQGTRVRYSSVANPYESVAERRALENAEELCDDPHYSPYDEAKLSPYRSFGDDALYENMLAAADLEARRCGPGEKPPGFDLRSQRSPPLGGREPQYLTSSPHIRERQVANRMEEIIDDQIEKYVLENSERKAEQLFGGILLYSVLGGEVGVGILRLQRKERRNSGHVRSPPREG